MGHKDNPAPAQIQFAASQKSPTDAQDNKDMSIPGELHSSLHSTKPVAPSATLSIFDKIRNYFLVRIGLRRAARTGWNGTRLVLGIVKESSDVFPPLKSTVGGLVAIIDIYERTRSNKSDMTVISEHIDRLLGLLASRLQGDRETVLSFVNEPYVQALTMQLTKLAHMKKEGQIRRLVNSAGQANDIRDVCKEIERTLQELQLKMGLSLERLTRTLLKEMVLQNLQRAEAAAYNAVVLGTATRRSCTPGTREDVLKEISEWALSLSPDTAPVYWISGLAGQGKTTIAHTICEHLRSRETQDVSVISFFCSRQLDSAKEKLLVSTLAFKLAEVSVSYASELLRVLPKDHDISNQKLDVQMSELLVGPWIRSAEHRVGLRPIVIVVDALDENEAGARFIELILAASRTEKGLPGLRILITSRPEPTIVPLCETIGERAICRLNSVCPWVVDGDIMRYLEAELPQHQGTDYLTDVANVSAGLFVYVATVVRLIKSTPRKTMSEEIFILRKVALRAPVHTVDRDELQRAALLYDLYDSIIADAFGGFPSGLKEARERVLLTMLCLGSLSRRDDDYHIPLTAFCADAEVELLHAVVESLSSILYISDGITFWHHGSFQDYILWTYRTSIIPTRLRILGRCILLLRKLVELVETNKLKMNADIEGARHYIREFENLSHPDRQSAPSAYNVDRSFYITGYRLRITLIPGGSSDYEDSRKWRRVREIMSSLRVELQHAQNEPDYGDYPSRWDNGPYKPSLAVNTKRLETVSREFSQ